MKETVTYNGRSFPIVSDGRATRPAEGLPHQAPVKATKAHRMIATALDGLPVAMGTLSLVAPPPSVNSLFFNARKGRGKTLVYRNWRAFADRELRDQPSWHVPGKVEIRICLPMTIQGDADNRIKATLDALVCAGRIEDDRNVVKVSAEFASVDTTVIRIQARDAA